MLLIPKIIYQGDRDVALSLKGAALAFHGLLAQQPEAVKRIGKQYKRLNDGSLLAVSFTQTPYHIHSTIEIYATPNGGEPITSGFLYKERDEAGELTGNVNLLLTNQNGYLSTLKNVTKVSDTAVWANHSATNPVLTAQQYQNGKKIIDDIAGETILLSFKAFGETFYVSQYIDHIDSLLGSGAKCKPITVRIKGKAQTFVLPFDVLDAIFVDASSTGQEFCIFTRLSDAEGYGPDFDYGLAYQEALRDKWEIVIRYQISKDSGGDFVFTSIYEYIQWAGYSLEETVTDSESVITELYNYPIFMQVWYEAAVFKALVFNPDAPTVSSLIAGSEAGIALVFTLGSKTLSIVQTPTGDSMELYRINPMQRYSKLKPILKTVLDGSDTLTTAIDTANSEAVELIDFTDFPMHDFTIEPFATVDYHSSGALDSVAINFSRLRFNVNPSLITLSTVLSPQIGWAAMLMRKHLTGTHSFKQVLSIFPRALFAQGWDFGFASAPINHDYIPIHSDFCTVLTDKFNNHLVISYGSDYELGQSFIDHDPIVTIKLWDKKLKKSKQPVTHLVMRSDILGVI